MIDCLGLHEPTPETICRLILLGSFLLMTLPLPAIVLAQTALRRNHRPIIRQGQNEFGDPLD